jgi:hypothetical protein
MHLDQQFSRLIDLYRNASVEFSHLKAVTLAMWILESGWGKSELAREHLNYAGMKYRKPMKPYAKPIEFKAHDGKDTYCEFFSLSNFITGFWVFLDRSPYEGWRTETDSPMKFIRFIGPIWAQDEHYAAKVLDLMDDAADLLDPAAGTGSSQFVCDACGSADGEADETSKPRVDRREHTSHQSSRMNVDIDHIVIHYTTSRNIDGSIDHFKNGDPNNPTSAHYIIGRDGQLVQMVSDGDNAWHAGNSAMNRRSIGIEHSAAPGDEITREQERVSIQLIKWLMEEYRVPKQNVIPHVCVKPTSCCGDLFSKYGGRAGAPCDVQKSALDAWMSEMGVV